MFDDASFESDSFSILAFDFGAGHISPSFDSAAFDTDFFSVVSFDLDVSGTFLPSVRYVRTTRRGRSF